MIGALNWLTPEMVHALGWTLVHFLWQGTAIALLLYIATSFGRSALLRYNLALAALLLMVASPVVTLFVLRGESAPAVQPSPIKQAWDAIQALPASAVDVPISTVNSIVSIDWLQCFVLAWFAGVLVLGVRALGGWVLLERLRRQKIQPIAASMHRRCLHLQKRLGLRRTIGYFESELMDSPAVVGWFRPVVLLPVATLVGLSPEQLEAVIAHELAHIQRFDCLVNLFQIAVETILFYHPAVWWVSRCVRVERENCCDDIAVGVCGNPGVYARALTLMETWRAAPAAALAANGGSLKSRIARLLGFKSVAHSVSRGGLAAVGVLCAAGALLASTTFNVSFNHPSDPGFVPAPVTEQSAPQAMPASVSAQPAASSRAILRSRTLLVARVAPAAERTELASSAIERAQSAPPPPPPSAAPPASPEPAPTPAALPASPEPAAAPGPTPVAPATPQEPATPPPPQTSSSGSYVDGIRSAGFTNISVDDLIALKVQGVTPEYIRDMRAAGLNPTVHELISMKAQGVTPEYVRDMRAAGLNPTVHELIGMKAQGVTPEYMRDMRSAGLTPTLRDLISMKAQGVTPEYVREIRSTGLNPSTHEFISMKAMGVSGDYVRKVRASWSDVTVRDLIAMRAQGVDPSDGAQYRQLGLKDVTTHQLISLKAMGVTPDYIRAMQAAGFSNLSTREYISAKAMGITPEFIQTARSHGFTNLTMRQLIGLKNANVF